jgi:hypothetical protein
VPSVSIIDNKDGSGITATVSGYATAALWTAPFTGNHNQSAFSQSATFSGDGSQAVSLSNGPYFAVWQLNGTFAAPSPFRVSDGSVGIHEECLRAIREFILSLSLPGYPTDPDKHKLHKRPVRSVTEFERGGLQGVHYWKLDDSLKPVDNYRNSVVYPVQIALIRSNSANNVADGDWTHSRQTIISSFTRCPLPAVPVIHTVEVVPSVLYYDTGELNVDLQSMIFRCVTELPAIL